MPAHWTRLSNDAYPQLERWQDAADPCNRELARVRGARCCSLDNFLIRHTKHRYQATPCQAGPSSQGKCNRHALTVEQPGVGIYQCLELGSGCMYLNMLPEYYESSSSGSCPLPISCSDWSSLGTAMGWCRKMFRQLLAWLPIKFKLALLVFQPPMV